MGDIREEPSYKYLRQLMLDTYSTDLVPDKKIFKDEILKLYRIKNHAWFDGFDFGDFKVEGSDRYLLYFVDLIKHFKFNLDDIKDKRILDIGPASGGTSLIFLALGAKEVISLEPDFANILRMRFLAKTFNLKLQAKRTTFEEFECDDKFDFINCFGVFYFIQGQLNALYKMNDLLSPKGLLVVETKTNEEHGNLKSEILGDWLIRSNFKFNKVDFHARSIFIAMTMRGL